MLITALILIITTLNAVINIVVACHEVMHWLVMRTVALNAAATNVGSMYMLTVQRLNIESHFKRAQHRYRNRATKSPFDTVLLVKWSLDSADCRYGACEVPCQIWDPEGVAVCVIAVPVADIYSADVSGWHIMRRNYFP